MLLIEYLVLHLHLFFLQTITVLNEGKLPRSIVVQLCDQFGNPAKVSDVRMQLTKEGKIKVIVVNTMHSHDFQTDIEKKFIAKLILEEFSCRDIERYLNNFWF